MQRVVIIDDSPQILDLLGMHLRRAGYQVVTALNVDDGMVAIRQIRPNVILLDLEMPGKDGVACLKELAADLQLLTIPVIMVSSSPEREIVLRVARLGVRSIVLKNEQLARNVLERVAQFAHGHQPAASGQHAPPQAAPAAAPAAAGRPARPAPSAPLPALNAKSAPQDSPEPDTMERAVLSLEGDQPDLDRAIAELKNLKPMMTRSDLMDRILSGNDLAALGPAVQQVLSLTRSPNSSIESISRAVKQDQALSLKILKVANSPLYARGERVENIHKAVARIGICEIQTTVLSLAVVDQFRTDGFAGRINAEWFWEHSIACGLIASRLIRLIGAGAESADSMFTAGLLHDVGRVLFAERLGDEYAAVIDAADNLSLPLETVESRLLLINHADLTDRLLRQWNFSAELVNPIALHHLSMGNIRRMAPRMVQQVAVLGLANRIAHALILGSSGNDVLYPIEEFVSALGLKPAHIAEICAAVPDETLDMRLALLSHASDALSASGSLLSQARAAIARGDDPPPNPLFVAVQPEIDSTAIALSRLSEAAPGGPPNLAIIRVTNARERAELMSRLKTAESDAGVANLPALVVASAAGCFFSEGSLGRRTVQQTVTPMRLSRLLHAIRSLLRAAPIRSAA